MSELIKIDAVEPLEHFWLRLTFSDGAVKDVDVGEILARGGVFEPIRERRELFEQVRVNRELKRSSGLGRSTSIRRCSTAGSRQAPAQGFLGARFASPPRHARRSL